MSNDEANNENRIVHAGFPNPAADSADVPLDLNKLVVKNRASTFYMRLESDSYEDMGLYAGDIITIDRALGLRSGDIFVGSSDGEFVITRYDGKKNGEIDLFGVVTHVIHKMRRANGKH